MDAEVSPNPLELALGHAEVYDKQHLVPCTTWMDPYPTVPLAEFEALKDEVRKLREEFESLANEQSNTYYDIKDLDDRLWNVESRLPE